jgi:hypothetical protein
MSQENEYRRRMFVWMLMFCMCLSIDHSPFLLLVHHSLLALTILHIYRIYYTPFNKPPNSDTKVQSRLGTRLAGAKRPVAHLHQGLSLERALPKSVGLKDRRTCV